MSEKERASFGIAKRQVERAASFQKRRRKTFIRVQSPLRCKRKLKFFILYLRGRIYFALVIFVFHIIFLFTSLVGTIPVFTLIDTVNKNK